MDGPHNIVRLEVAPADAELAADALWQADPSAVHEERLADGRVRLTADVARPSDVDRRWSPQLLAVDDEGYLDAWRRWARTTRAGERFVLHPAWLPDPPLRPDDLLVRLDPGRAFGSGSHPSTRLVLGAIERWLRPGDVVLDVGCGSGVLAVGACLLGAARVLALDVDEQAVDATAANAAANGVADRVEASTTPLAAVDGPADVVLANIGARTLRQLAPDLVRVARPGGVLVLAGLLADQADRVVAALEGCTERERPAEDGWVAPVLVAPG